MYNILLKKERSSSRLKKCIVNVIMQLYVEVKQESNVCGVCKTSNVKCVDVSIDILYCECIVSIVFLSVLVPAGWDLREFTD